MLLPESRLTLYRRHLKTCPNQSQSERNCACPIWCYGRLDGRSVRYSLRTTNWMVAQEYQGLRPSRKEPIDELAAARVMLAIHEHAADSELDGFVYFVSDGGAVKIGTSKDPSKRFEALGTATPRNLSVRRIFRGGAVLEREIHRLLEAQRIRGEWYRANSTTNAIISRTELFSIALRRAAA